MRRTPAIPLLLICASSLPATEHMLDLRGRIGGATVLDEIEDRGVDGRAGLSTSLCFMWGALISADRRWGFCLGGGTFWDSHSGERSGRDTTYEARGLEVSAGAVHAIDQRWHVELRALTRYGEGSLETYEVDEDSFVFAEGDEDEYGAFGIVAGGFHTFPFGLQLGIEASWLEWRGDSEIAGIDVESAGDGLMLVGTIGYRF